MIQNSHVWVYTAQEIKMRISKRYLYCSIIHNNQDMAITKCPLTDEKMKNRIYAYNGVLVQLKKDGNSAIFQQHK